MPAAHTRKLRAASVGLALVAVAALFAACGGASGPGVASLGSSTTTTTSPPAGASGGNKEVNYLDAVKYAQCMRTHGVPNMPDPTSDGSFLYDRGLLNGQRVDVRSAQYNSADKACTHLLPNGGKPTAAGLQYALTQLLKYVRCLRTHGLPNTPDPVESKGGVGMRLPGNPNSPQVQSAMKACKSFAPGG
ncbi:MAG: hypothetical protein WB770_03620 [Acidimicrobiales bacterium]